MFVSQSVITSPCSKATATATLLPHQLVPAGPASLGKQQLGKHVQGVETLLLLPPLLLLLL
jgi:hypothetical protein